MKFLSPVYSAVSGSIAGITYSRNRYGMYTRARATPVNPNTDAQRAARDALANGVVYWTETLTQAVRDAWSDYAENVPLTDALGQTKILTGQSMFLRTYLARAAAGALQLITAPTVFDLGDFTPLTFVASAATDDVEVTFNTSDAWAATAGGWATIALGVQQNGSRFFYKSPFRIQGIVEGDSPAPTSPINIDYGSPLLLGNALWAKYVIMQVDGRTSTENIVRIEVEA